MKKYVILLAVIFILINLVPMASAQEPAADNACNPGGSMDGKCTTDWHWNCGWYVARYESGEYNLLQVPKDCAESLIIPYLPPAQIAELVNLITTICRSNESGVYCASSDQTGTGDYRADGILDWIAVFISNTACPTGYFLWGPTTDFMSGGFTLQDLNALGLLPNFCVDFLP